jgi:hypothetical protein
VVLQREYPTVRIVELETVCPDPLTAEKLRGQWLQALARRKLEDSFVGNLRSIVEMDDIGSTVAVAGHSGEAFEPKTLRERVGNPWPALSSTQWPMALFSKSVWT